MEGAPARAFFSKKKSVRTGAPSSRIGWKKLKHARVRKTPTGKPLRNASLKTC